MCLQDIEIMSLSGSFATKVLVAAALTPIVGVNQNRIGLIIRVVTGGACNVSMRGDLTAADGFALTPGNPQIELNVFQHGDMCRRQWNGFGVGGATTVEVVELVLDVALARKTGYGAPPDFVAGRPAKLEY